MHQEPPSGNLVLGRCIHLDSTSAVGTPFDKAILKHLDLEINVYHEERASDRLKQHLDKGMTADYAAKRKNTKKQ